VIRRREFITLLGGAAAWPISVRAQQPERMRRIGILQNLPENDPVALALVAVFLKELQQSGWTVGSNISVETRWAGTASDDIRRHAAELVALAPDIILANGTSTLGPLLQQSKTIPIVFVQVTDPVGSGYVSSLARPGGNATGFAAREYGVSGKWLEVLKQIAPAVRRAGVIRNPAVPSGSGQFGAIQAVAPYLGIDVTPIDVRSTAEIERMAGLSPLLQTAALSSRPTEQRSRTDKQSSRRRRGINCLQCIGNATSLRRAASSLMARTEPISTGERPDTWIAFCRAAHRRTYPYKRQPSTRR
jgi:ABC-type uncharacterized transport system substrate-binding protein